MAGSRVMALRFAGVCCACQAAIAKGDQAYWDATERTVSCLSCSSGSKSIQAPPEPDPVATDMGAPGASAIREHDRRHDKRQARVRAAHPRLGGLLLALSNDPTSTTVWQTGARGERLVGELLLSLADRGIVSMHDRRIPGSKANIDHIAVGPSGVFVIDAKRYSGEVTHKTVGPFWRPGPSRLFVNGRDKTSLVEGMAKQMAAVDRALVGLEPLPDTRAMLCFVEAEFGWFAKPFEIGGVWVGWRRALADAVTQPGRLSPDEVGATAIYLAKRLPPA
jgi:hypothetical protein